MATVREDQYLEDVYGILAKIEREEWLEKMQTEAKWALDSAQIRKRLFHAAGVVVRHQ